MISTLTNNLVLISRFEDHNLVFCSLYIIHKICVFCQNMVHENVTRIVKSESQVVKLNSVIVAIL